VKALWLFPITILLACHLSAQAGGDFFEKKYELQFAPNLGWSNFSGYLLGLDAAVLLPLSERWQWKSAGSFTARTKNDYVSYSLETGAVYNFSDDWNQAFFVGAGIGYGNQKYVGPYDEFDNRLLYGYAEVGKRLKLNKSGSITWVPTATVSTNSFKHAEIGIHPLNFSWSF
jgi:hypothetical protein